MCRGTFWNISTLNTAPKNAHAASQPAITAVCVWEYVNQTNMCRLSTAVKIRQCTRRRRPVSGSSSKPSWAKSTWHSTPGSPSATRTVVPRPIRHPHPLPGQQLLDLHDQERLVLHAVKLQATTKCLGPAARAEASLA